MIRATLLAGIAALAALGGCGGGAATAPEHPPFEVMLDFFPNADHAPLYAAEAAGAFERAGLDLRIRQPPDPAAPIKQVAAGRVDLAISYEPEVLRARDQGLPVVSVGALVQEPLTSIVSLPEAGIESPRDLAGKRVGTAGIDYQSAFLQAILRDAGVDPGDVEETNVGFDLSQALLTGKVDAVLGAFWNYEGTDLRLRGKDPRIIRVEDAGVPTYNELVLVAGAERLERDPAPVRAFLEAVARGERELRRDPDGALDALLAANPELDERLQAAVLDVTAPLFAPPRGRPWGWQDPREWAAFARFMHGEGLLEEEPPKPAPTSRRGGPVTNELLPGR